MSQKRCRIGIEPNPGSAEIYALTIAPKGVGDATYNAGSIDQQQIEPHTPDAPIGVVYENDFGGGDQSSLLSIRKRGCRIGQPGTSLDLHDGQKTIFFCDHIDLACRRSKPARQDAPTIPFQRQPGGLFRVTASPVSGLPST
jgi:hypothetical protein